MIPLRDNQPTRTFPFVTLLIIAVNAFVFIGWQQSVGLEQSVDRAGFLPIELTNHLAGRWTHVFTSMFMHGGWMHLIGNMWFLWIFGNNIEDNCGPIRYLIFYLLCGIAATLAFTAIAPRSEVPLVGASGAISGVLGAYLLHHPKARVLTLIPIFFFIRIVELPAWFFLLGWIGLQIVSQFLAARAQGIETSGVAYAAHIGGFIAGMGLIVFFEKGRDRRRSRA
ncbi:MAG: rhomboid family intramembrane serine protease [Chthoniobacter sp.]|uniref:rhomboid family intramembrane serine protease n=1 Tax=Chthoniobacter sp. TaxID=2510640 RepID=UPI0032A39BE5